MMQQETKYEEWLTTIANTRILYNTMEELEEMLGNHSIHNNGIKRCFFTPQRLRSAFRDLKVEVEVMTDGDICLDKLLMCYQKTWNFYRDNLFRRTNPEQVALELVEYCYPPYMSDGLSPKKVSIFEQVKEQHIDLPLLLLMLLKALPGYDSKEGDVTDMPTQYERVLSFMSQFMDGKIAFEVLPAINKAREEKNKTRLMLVFHIRQILDTYRALSDSSGLYELSCDIKYQAVNLDIVGFWNECGGKLLFTDFWQIEDALNFGSYFLTKWHKDADNKLTGIRYQLMIWRGEDGRLCYYIMHPQAMQQHMKGLPLGDADHTWYQSSFVEETPMELPMQRKLFSGVWPKEILLTRCTDVEVVAQYNKWIDHDCTICKPYQHLEYYFVPKLYAITPTHLYISADREGEYYKVPRSAHEGFDRVQLGDNVGVMQMGDKSYLVFDELLLFIHICKEELHRYNIERVCRIE